MKARRLWLLYAAAYLGYSAGAFFWLKRSAYPTLAIDAFIGEVPYLLFLVGVVGLAMHWRIISRGFWRVVFGFSVLVLAYSWVMLPVMNVQAGHLSIKQALLIQLFAVPALPMFVALFIYAWRSPSLWAHAAQQGAPGDVPRPAGSGRA